MTTTQTLTQINPLISPLTGTWKAGWAVTDERGKTAWQWNKTADLDSTTKLLRRLRHSDLAIQEDTSQAKHCSPNDSDRLSLMDEMQDGGDPYNFVGAVVAKRPKKS